MTARKFLLKARRKTTYELWRMNHRLHGRRFVHFLHISKTGGTAVKHALELHRFTQDYAIILHNHEMTLSQVPTGELTFFFLRDPVARFVSAFNARYRQERPRYDTPWTQAERAAFEEFRSANELGLGLSDIDPAKRARAIAAMRGINRVNQPYTDWFVSEDELLSRASSILFVGFQETLEDDFERLKCMLGLPSEVSLPGDPVTANRAPSSQKTEITEAANTNLRSWFAEDYRILSAARKLANRETATSPSAPLNST